MHLRGRARAVREEAAPGTASASAGERTDEEELVRGKLPEEWRHANLEAVGTLRDTVPASSGGQDMLIVGARSTHSI